MGIHLMLSNMLVSRRINDSIRTNEMSDSQCISHSYPDLNEKNLAECDNESYGWVHISKIQSQSVIVIVWQKQYPNRSSYKVCSTSGYKRSCRRTNRKTINSYCARIVKRWEMSNFEAEICSAVRWTITSFSCRSFISV